MSSANVLPSAPPENLYPQISPPDFRMQKVNEISTALNKEVGHYRAVAKKYKRAKKVFNLSAKCELWFRSFFCRLDSKIKKHREIVTLAIAKRDTIDRLLSKALTDNIISGGEFQLIMAKFSQYNVLKDSVRAKLTRHSSRPDVEKIKKDVRSEMEADFRKKISALAAGSN